MTSEGILYCLLGLVVGYVWLTLSKKVTGMNEFSRIKNDLKKFVSNDKRIQSLFPPEYVCSAGAVDETPFSSSNWLDVSEGRVAEIKTSLERRIEKAALESRDFADAMRYAFKKPGKMIRSRLVILLGDILQVDSEKLVLLAQAVELEHCASLLHDDVVDDADMRRGIESHRKKFGDRVAVLTGDNLISILVDVLTDIGDMRVTETVSSSIEALVIGELIQLMGSLQEGGNLDHIFPINIRSNEVGNLIYIYLRKSFFKTASLFACLSRCVGLLADKQLEPLAIAKLTSFGFFFGLAFQLVDDLLDLTETADDELVVGKPVGGCDVRNGTITLPILLAADEGLGPTEQQELLKMIKRRFKLGGDVERVFALIQKSGAIDRSRKIVSYFLNRARADLRSVVNDTHVIEGLLRDYESRRC